MNRLTAFYQVTKQLEELLEKPVTAKNRESVINQANELIEKRGSFLDEVTPPFTEDEKLIGNQLVQMNTAIQQKMDSLFTDLKQEMKQIKQQKKSNVNYTNPYKSVGTMDGMFMDSKN